MKIKKHSLVRKLHSLVTASAAFFCCTIGFAQEFKRIDAALDYGEKVAYFFEQDLYTRYEKVAGRGGPATNVSFWKLPNEFSAGIDAALNYGNGTCYFFKGDKYVSYNIKTQKAGPVTGISYWNLPGSFSKGIDAALNYGGNTCYFFRGDKYVKYDTAKQQAGPITGISYWGFPTDFSSGIDAAIRYKEGVCYFFKGDRYIRYDVATAQAGGRTSNEYWKFIPSGPAHYFRPELLTCHETQDSGEDEIVLRIWVDGVERRIPAEGEQGEHVTDGERDMNEDDDELSRWEIGEEFKFYESIKLELWDYDDSEHSHLGTLETGPFLDGQWYKDFVGDGNAYLYNLGYTVSSQAGARGMLAAPMWSQSFFDEHLEDAIQLGGQHIEDSLEAQNDELDKLQADLQRLANLADGNAASAEGAKELAKEVGLTVTSQAAGAAVIGGILSYKAAATASVASVAMGGVAGTSAAAAAAGSVAATAGVALIAIAGVSAVVAPLWSAGQDGVAVIQFVNESDHALVIDGFERGSGEKTNGPDVGSVIPPRQLVEGSSPPEYRYPMVTFCFDKKWGMTGIVGEIDLKLLDESSSDRLPDGLHIEYSVPHVGDNWVAVNLTPSDDSKQVVTSSATSTSRGQDYAACAISSSEGWFPKLIFHYR